MAGKRKNNRQSAGSRITEKAVAASDAPPPAQRSTAQVMAETDEDPFQKDCLTIRQRRFVDALVGPAGGNATKAAEMAGYRADNRDSLKVTASENLTKPNVQEAIAHAYARLKMGPEWSKAALQEIASSSMGNFVTIDAAGNAKLDMVKAAAAGAIGQIKEWSEDVISIPGNESAVIKRRIKLHDRGAAVLALLKIQGIMKDAPEREAVVKIIVEYEGGVNVHGE